MPRIKWSRAVYIAAALSLPTAAVLAMDAAIHPHWRIKTNISNSLPGYLFVMKVGSTPSCGDYVQMRVPDDAPMYPGVPLLKKVVGCAGDVVTSDAGNYYVNGQFMGYAAELLSTGEVMEPGPVGVIPEGSFYVAGEHSGSFDSRYAAVGWVDARWIEGAAWEVF